MADDNEDENELTIENENIKKISQKRKNRYDENGNEIKITKKDNDKKKKKKVYIEEEDDDEEEKKKEEEKKNEEKAKIKKEKTNKKKNEKKKKKKKINDAKSQEEKKKLLGLYKEVRVADSSALQETMLYKYREFVDGFCRYTFYIFLILILIRFVYLLVTKIENFADFYSEIFDQDKVMNSKKNLSILAVALTSIISIVVIFYFSYTYQHFIEQHPVEAIISSIIMTFIYAIVISVFIIVFKNLIIIYFLTGASTIILVVMICYLRKHRSMKYSLHILKKYILFSINHSSIRFIGLFLANIFGRILVILPLFCVFIDGYDVLKILNFELIYNYNNNRYRRTTESFLICEDEEKCKLNFSLVCLLLFDSMSLYIIQKVILNVITCVISGTYAQFHLKEITGGKDVDIEEYKMNRKYKKEEENIISIDKELVSESKINLKNNVDESDNESDEYSILAEMNGQKLLISNNVSQNEKRTILNLLKNMNNIILKDYESTSSNNEDDDISIRQKSKNDDDNENNNSYDDDDITINIYDDYSSSSDEEYSLSTKEKEEEEEEDINNGKVIIIDEEQPDDLIGDDSELIFRGKRFSQDNKVLIFGKVNSNKNYIKKINLYNEKKSKKYNIDDDNNNNQENDETTNDETTNDEITNDEITNDEITNDEITNDENVKNENKNDKKKDKNKKDKNKNDSAKMKARQIKRKEKEKQRKEQIKKILERKNNIIENNRKLAEENNKNFLVRNYFRLSVTDYLGSVSAQVLVNLFFIVVTVIKILIILIITLIAFVIYILLLYFVGYFTGGRGVDRLTSKILKLAYNIIKLLLPFYFPYFSNFIDMIIYGRGYLEAFVSEDNLNAVITATLPVKVIKYAGALHCGFFAGTIALIMCLIFGFPTLHIFPCFVVIFEFLIGIITFQPIISGSQAANYCYYRNKVPVESQDSYIKSFISKDTLNLESNNEFYYEKMTPFLPDIPLKKSKSNQEDNDKLNETNNNNKILKSNIYDDNTEKDNVDSNENVSNNITPSNNTKASNNIEILVQIDDDN